MFEEKEKRLEQLLEEERQLHADSEAQSTELERVKGELTRKCEELGRETQVGQMHFVPCLLS